MPDYVPSNPISNVRFGSPETEVGAVLAYVRFNPTDGRTSSACLTTEPGTQEFKLKVSVGEQVGLLPPSPLRATVDTVVAYAVARRRASADKSATLRKRFALVAGKDG